MATRLLTRNEYAEVLAQCWADALNEVYMNDNEIEQEIIAKGKTAPRVTLAQVESCIAYEYYVNASELTLRTTPVLGPACARVEHPEAPLSVLTLCVLVLCNGFTVTGESAPASPENFDAELGRKVARQNALSKIWMLEGYLLKERLHRDAINRSSGGGDFGDS